MENVTESKKSEQVEQIINTLSDRKKSVLSVDVCLLEPLKKELELNYPQAKIKWAGLFGTKRVSLIRESSAKTFNKTKS